MSYGRRDAQGTRSAHSVGTAGLRSRMTHALPAQQGQPSRGHLGTRGLQRALRRDGRPAWRQGRMRGGLRSGQRREPRDRGHVTAEAPEAEPRAGCGLPGGTAPTCPCSPGECGSPRGLTCPRPPPPSAHYVMPRHAPAQPTGARAAERKHTVHVARAAGPCEGGGRRAGSPGLGIPAAPRERRPHRRATPRLPPALTRVQFHGARRGAALTAPPGAAGGGVRGPASWAPGAGGSCGPPGSSAGQRLPVAALGGGHGS